jgi:hypothetical protein
LKRLQAASGHGLLQPGDSGERSNARLKDAFGARHVMVKGAPKVMSHLMFGVLARSADQLMRLRQ